MSPFDQIQMSPLAYWGDHGRGSKDAAVKAQEKLGEAIDSDKHKAKGEARQVEGKTQQKMGDVTEGVDKITRKP